MVRRENLYKFEDQDLTLKQLIQNRKVFRYLTRTDKTTPSNQVLRMRLYRGLRDGTITQGVVEAHERKIRPIPKPRTRIPNPRTRPTPPPRTRPTPAPRTRTKITVQGKTYTAKQALTEYPQLVGFLQPKKKIKQKSLEAKFRAWFKKGKIPEHILNEQPPEFVLTRGALGGTFQEYKLEDERLHRHGIRTVFDYVKDRIINLINQHNNTKLYLVINTTMYQPTSGDVQEKRLHSATIEFLAGTDPEVTFKTIRDVVYERLAKLEHAVGSGWVLQSIDSIFMRFAELKVSAGSSYKPLPADVENRKAILNMKNNDNECFKWAVTRALNPVKKNGERITENLKKQAEQFDWMGVKFPASFKDIDVFENLNKISIKVVGWDEETNEVEHLRLPQVKYNKTATLFLHDEHYSVVVNMSRLTAKDNKAHTLYYCPYCAYKHKKTEKVEVHKKICQLNELTEVIMPEQGECVSFKNFEFTLRKPYVIYADFECRFEDVDNNIGENTTQTNRHIPIGYCYRVVSDIDPAENRTYQYTAVSNDEDVSLHFVDSIYKTVQKLGEKHSVAKPMVITSEQQEEFENAKECWVCKGEFYEKNKKVRDHCHFTGIYRGAAHNKCNLRLKQDKTVPVLFHNGQGYDFHLLVHNLGKLEGEIDVIAKNDEQHISLTKYITSMKWKLRFLDSLSFLQASLSNLSKNLLNAGKENFKTTLTEFDNDLVLKKGVFPYEWLTDVEKLAQTELPPIEAFYSSLNDQGISEDDYKHAQSVWSTFKCKSMRDYHDLYCKSDVLQLTDVFEYQRKNLMATHGLDLLHFFSLPGFSWQALLKYTGQRLELISDKDMFDFVQKGMRGGISSIITRYAKANNPYMGDKYDSSKETSYIQYLDANNLYGWAMSKPLPVGGFEWVFPKTIEDLKDVPCFVMCDLEIPKNLFDKFSELVPAPEKIVVNKVEKLIPNLRPKKEYVCHINNLKQYSKLGVVVTKIHKALKFEERPWMKSYIDLNTDFRTKATNDADSNMFKLLNNAVFGKTMENLFDRSDVRLVNTKKKAIKLVAKKQFKNYTIYNEDLVGISLEPSKVRLNKPSYVGCAILDISKTLIYDFHYKMKERYGNDAKLLFTDTDSLCYHIKTADWYDDIRGDVEKYYDTSNYPVNHPAGLPRVNKKVIGLMKDEVGGGVIDEFCGNRAKSYCFTVLNRKTEKKCKGIKKGVIKKHLTMKDYKNCVLGGVVKRTSQTTLRSRKHTIYTENVCKVALSPYDDKRAILDDGINTVPIGHYSQK